MAHNLVFGIHLPYGNLYIYGESVKYCSAYMEGLFDCVEDVCEYAQMHCLKIFYEMGYHNIWKSFKELLRVTRLTRRYSIYSSANEFGKYVDDQYEKYFS